MDKVLVEVFIPAANASYDIYIPLACRIGDILQMISKVTADLTDGKYKSSRTTVLCDRGSGVVIDINKTAAEVGLKNGSAVMMI